MLMPGDKSYANVVWLNGGKAFVPYKLWSKFVFEVSKDMMVVQNKEPGYYPSYACERPPQDPMHPRRLLFDMDFEGKTEVSLEFIQNVFLCVGKTLQMCFPKNKQTKLWGVVLKAEPKKTKSGSVKSGFHVAFPEVILTRHQCRQVVCLLNVHLLQHFNGDRTGPMENSFENAIDYSIYDGGLRLPGSLKAEKCPCRKGQLCGQCNNGIISEYRPYNFYCLLDEAGNILEKEHDLFVTFQVHATPAMQVSCVTMNCPDKVLVEDFKYPENAPQPFPNSRKKKKGKQLNMTNRELWQNETKRFLNRRRNLVPILPIRPIFQDIVECIRNVHNVYSRITVTNVNQSMRTGDYIVNVESFGCHDCFIKGNMKNPVPHKNNQIWFYISRKENRIYQHCFHPNCKASKKELAQPSAFTKQRIFGDFQKASQDNNNSRKKSTKQTLTVERKSQLLDGFQPKKRKVKNQKAHPKKKVPKQCLIRMPTSPTSNPILPTL